MLNLAMYVQVKILDNGEVLFFGDGRLLLYRRLSDFDVNALEAFAEHIDPKSKVGVMINQELHSQ